ncbi:hypothetical protein IFR05_004860 [Cadophora sp. M221]|nr:hypothetical protein IFR05_004860 [Cadophora sp. M221]
MTEHPHTHLSLGDSYQHDVLPTKTSFMIFELLPGVEDDPISYLLCHAEWDDLPAYEAIFYAWGDTKSRADQIDHLHFSTLFLSTDTVYLKSINQTDMPDRSHQIAQKRKIHGKAAKF